jgi:hypothetical protein
VAKSAPDSTLDGLLAQVALADEMYVCSAQPTNYADIANSDLVGPIAMTPGTGNGDFLIADGDTNGRKVTVLAQSDASIIASGTASHVVLATGGATDLLRYITTCTNQALTSGGTVDVPAWKVEVADPT